MVSKLKARSKSSQIKRTNKHMTKLQKRGKLRKKKKFEKQSNQGCLSQETNNYEEIDPSDMTNEKDLKYLMKKGNQYRFLNLTNTDQTTGKRKKFSEQEADYEQEVYKRFKRDKKKQLKPLLPIKGKQGVIQQYLEIEEEVEDSYEEMQTKLVETETKDDECDLKHISEEELLKKRNEKLVKRKEKIATLAMKILENPEENIKCLKELRLMLDEKDRDIVITNRKLVAASLLEVFKDILPSYRIRPMNDTEKKQKLKKETKHLQDYEQAVLRHYKAYLQRLEMMLKGLKQKNTIPGQPLYNVGEIAVQCLCELLISHPSFNFRNNIIVLLVPLMTHKTEEISSLVCDTIKKLFRADKLGDISLEIVKHISRLLKEKNYMVQPKVLNTFLTLKIHIIKEENDNEKKFMTRKEKMMKLSRMERKRNKQMEKLELELQETRAEESKKHKSKLHTEIISLIFVIYFKILKGMPKSQLLPSVLEGLAKFAHLINVDFFDDLITALHQCISSGELSYRENLHCIQTAFTILSGQGDALNIDPQRFYTHLYKNVLSLRDGIPSPDIPILLTCLDLAFIQRKKQITIHRVLAFMKRLCTVSLHLPLEGIISMLVCLKSLMQNHRQTDSLLETDISQGSGIYLPELEEPEHCNANATAIWELHLLLRHQHPDVKKLAQQILEGNPPGPKELSLTSAVGKTPEEVWKLYDSWNSLIEMPSYIPGRIGKKTRLRYTGGEKFLNEELEAKIKSLLESEEDYQNINYFKLFKDCNKGCI